MQQRKCYILPMGNIRRMPLYLLPIISDIWWWLTLIWIHYTTYVYNQALTLIQDTKRLRGLRPLDTPSLFKVRPAQSQGPSARIHVVVLDTWLSRHFLGGKHCLMFRKGQEAQIMPALQYSASDRRVAIGWMQLEWRCNVSYVKTAKPCQWCKKKFQTAALQYAAIFYFRQLRWRACPHNLAHSTAETWLDYWFQASLLQ